MSLKLGGQVFGVRIAQVADLGAAAILQGCIEVGDQRPQPQPAALVTAYQDAVGAGIRDKARRHRHAVGAWRLRKRRQHPDNLGGRRVFKRDDLNVVIGGKIDAANDIDHPLHVTGPIGNDEHVGAWMSCQVSVLRNQGSKNRHELCGTDVVHLNHLSHHVVRSRAVRGRWIRMLSRSRIRNDLDDVTRGYGDIAMHLKDR